MTVDEWIGATGVFFLLLAYFLNLVGALANDSRAYQSLNLAGAGVACWASWRIGFLPFVVLEAIWTLVSAIALMRGRAR